MARFVLMHLTPAARNAFRIYRDAHRAAVKQGEAEHTAWLRFRATQHDIANVVECGREVHPDLTARLARLEEAHQRADARRQATSAAATAACQVALPLLADEGYPFAWWHTGTMRLPAGVESPGANRLARR